MEELRFIEISKSYGVRIVYLNATRVIYAIGSAGSPGAVTMLCNPDGTPLVWKGDCHADS